MNIQLSEHFTYAKLLRFTLPTIITMIFTSIYSIVDGIFISNFVGKTPFAAINLIFPFIMVLGAVGFMLGTGGSALVAKTLGEGKTEKANGYFSMIILVAILAGILLTILGQLVTCPIAILLGAEGEMLDYAVLYARVLLLGLVPFILQYVFQSFLVTAERPNLGLALTVGAGVTNMALDLFFIAVFRWGVTGAALATCISQAVGGLIPLVYFICPNGSPLRLVTTRLEVRPLCSACMNGASEMVSNLSTSLVSMLYNFQLLRMIGEDGVAAYGVIMYINFIFIGVFLGYSLGSAPIVSYHYGANNQPELQNLFKKSLILIGASSITLTGIAIYFATPLSKIFVGYDTQLLQLTSRGFCLYALSFLVMGLNIFGSAFFTALNNGAISAMISFLRTLLFQIAAILLLPIFFDIDGIWLAVATAELGAALVTVSLLLQKRQQYRYF